MRYKQPRKPRKKDLRNPPRHEPEGEWVESIGTDYHDHEVPHPFVDLCGAPISYVNCETGEQMLDLIHPESGEFEPMPVAALVLLSFEGPPPCDELVPCYRDGDVKNAALTNIYWGLPSDPNSGLSLHQSQPV